MFQVPLRENREAGANPARARHCEWGANLQEATATRPRYNRTFRLQSIGARREGADER